MTPEEIQELLDLTGWSRTRLAAELGVVEGTIHSWLSRRRSAGGPACILMRQWLTAARAARKPSGRRAAAKM